MRLDKPRIAPVTDAEFTDEYREAMEPYIRTGRLPNVVRTLARAPDAFKAFHVWADYVLSDRNSLAPREREIVVLRVGYLCRSGYEFAQHTRIGLREGLTPEEIENVKRGPEGGWSAADAALVRTSDEIVATHFVSASAWSELLAHFSERQAMDVVFTATQYVQVSTLLNAFGVQAEPGLQIDPELRRPA